MNSRRLLLDTFSPRIKGNEVVIDELGMSDDEIRAVKKIMIVACGSAYHAGVTGKYIFEGHDQNSSGSGYWLLNSVTVIRLLKTERY